MIEEKEKFIIRVTEKGVDLRAGEGQELHFTASEALMLLDILRHEEEFLKRRAKEASPLPLRICVSNDGSSHNS